MTWPSYDSTPQAHLLYVSLNRAYSNSAELIATLIEAQQLILYKATITAQSYLNQNFRQAKSNYQYKVKITLIHNEHDQL